MSIPTPFRDSKGRSISETIMRIAEIMGREGEFYQYSRYADSMIQSHPRDYSRVKLEVMKTAPSWIQLLLEPLNDLYIAGHATGYVEAAALYGKKDEAIRKMRKSPSENENEKS